MKQSQLEVILRDEAIVRSYFDKQSYLQVILGFTSYSEKQIQVILRKKAIMIQLIFQIFTAQVIYHV